MYTTYFVLLLSFVSFGCGLQQNSESIDDAIAICGDTPAALYKRDDVPTGYYAPPYYPTPKGGWVSSWADAYVKAQQVVANMSLAEKVNLTTGTGMYMVCSTLLYYGFV
jgi:hypothetical protein